MRRSRSYSCRGRLSATIWCVGRPCSPSGDATASFAHGIMTDSKQELLENWPHHPTVRRDILSEHWPRRKSSTPSSSFDSDSLQGATHKSHRVRFPDASAQLYVYECYSISLLRSLAYTKEDLDEFGKDALAEGLRIKQLIDMSP